MIAEFKTEDGFTFKSGFKSDGTPIFTDGDFTLELWFHPVNDSCDSVPVPTEGIRTLDGVLKYQGKVYRVEFCEADWMTDVTEVTQ